MANPENFWLAMAFSPDGQNLAIGSAEGTISLWSVAQPNQPRLRFHLPGHRGTITSLVFDTQGRRLASAGTDPLVEVWDLDLIVRELIAWGWRSRRGNRLFRPRIDDAPSLARPVEPGPTHRSKSTSPAAA